MKYRPPCRYGSFSAYCTVAGLLAAIFAACAGGPGARDVIGQFVWDLRARQAGASDNFIVHNGVGLNLHDDFAFFAVSGSSFILPGDPTAYGEFGFQNRSKSISGFVERFVRPPTMRSEDLLAYYRAHILNRYSILSTVAVALSDGTSGWIVQVRDPRDDAAFQVLLLPDTPLGTGTLVQVRGSAADAQTIFASLSFHAAAVSLRRMPAGPRFQCTDGEWRWISDTTGGIVVRRGDTSKLTMAIVANSVALAHSDSDHLLGEERGTFSFEPLMANLSQPKLSGRIYEQTTLSLFQARSFSFLLPLKQAGFDFTIMLRMKDKPRLTPDGRLDEPAIEALLSTYLSFEAPGT